MQNCWVIDIFRQAGAILEGHFILTSGLHSPVFLQKARVFMYPEKTSVLCKALAEKIHTNVTGPIDYLVGPAIGGLIPAYETSRYLKVPCMWVEREEGVFQLKRFEIEPGARIVIVEDIVTTGLSISETISCLRKVGAKILSAACIVDRSAGKAELDVPLLSLAEYEIPVYSPEKIPNELKKIPAIQPGSRKIRHTQ